MFNKIFFNIWGDDDVFRKNGVNLIIFNNILFDYEFIIKNKLKLGLVLIKDMIRIVVRLCYKLFYNLLFCFLEI